MNALFTIDLVICTYNNYSLLNRTLQALYNSKVPVNIKWSVLVVNNNCTDETETVVNRHMSKGILPLRTVIETTQGLTNARVCGVKNTQAAWVAFVDDDCLLADNWIEEAEKFILTHPGCGIFGSRIQLLWEKEPPSYVSQFPFAFAGKNHGDAPKRLKTVAGAGMVVKREALQKCGWIEEQFLADRVGQKLVSGGDMEIAHRTGAYFEVWYNPACTLQHIIPERRTTKKYLQQMLFGLGASRHNEAALSWGGSYVSWFLYSCAYSVGMFGLCMINFINGKSRSAGAKVVFSPFFGWNAAIGSMLHMDKLKRKKLLGCANKAKLL